MDEVVLHPGRIPGRDRARRTCGGAFGPADAEHNAREWVRMLWNTPMRTGARRYYDNFLYAFAMLALSGKYRYE